MKQVALKSIVDDFSTLAIEACLVSKLPDLFTPEEVAALSDEDVRNIASEGESITQDRIRLAEKKMVLSNSLHELKSLNWYQQSRPCEYSATHVALYHLTLMETMGLVPSSEVDQRYQQ
jgi:hypothetical protein